MIGTPVTAPRPNFVFGPLSRDRVDQTTIGLAYDGRWKDVGEISFGVSRADYRKTTTFPGLALVLTVLAFNLVGDGLQDALNPRTAK